MRRPARSGLLLALLLVPLLAAAEAPAPAAGPKPVLLPAAGQKVWVNPDFYFAYEFDRRPTMGTVILKIRLFARDGTRSTVLDVKGSADMPSMRGAHYSGDHPFKVSKKGDYLLPIDIVMPGDWEVQLIFSSKGAVVYRGYFLFDV